MGTSASSPFFLPISAQTGPSLGHTVTQALPFSSPDGPPRSKTPSSLLQHCSTASETACPTALSMEKPKQLGYKFHSLPIWAGLANSEEGEIQHSAPPPALQILLGKSPSPMLGSTYKEWSENQAREHQTPYRLQLGLFRVHFQLCLKCPEPLQCQGQHTDGHNPCCWEC